MMPVYDLRNFILFTEEQFKELENFNNTQVNKARKWHKDNCADISHECEIQFMRTFILLLTEMAQTTVTARLMHIPHADPEE